MGSKSDISIGKKFGDWTVVAIDVKNPNSHAKRVRMCALCECKCGKQQYIEYRSLYDGRTTNCGCEWRKEAAKKRYNNNIIPIGTVFGYLTVVDDAGMQHTKHYSKCQCICGNIIEVSNTHLKTGHTRSCGCISASHGVQKIKQILTDNNINFKTEYVFDNLLSPLHAPLRFDFAIFNNNQLIKLIEFDGPQHFKEYDGYFKNKLEQIQLYDNLKNQYCKEHNIILLRIPYTDIEKIDLNYLMK